MRQGLAAGAVLLAAVFAPGSPASVREGFYPSCRTIDGMAPEQVVNNADEKYGSVICRYKRAATATEPAIAFSIHAQWVGDYNDNWQRAEFGCGRSTGERSYPSQDYVADVYLSAGVPRQSWIDAARDWLLDVEYHAMPCSGPPEYPKFKWRVAINRSAADPRGFHGYRRTEAKGNGTFTTNLGGTAPAGVSGSIAFVHRLKKGSKTIVVKLARAEQVVVIGKNKALGAVGVVTFSEHRRCEKGSRVEVYLNDIADGGDRLDLGTCGKLDGMVLDNTKVRGQRVKVQINSA